MNYRSEIIIKYMQQMYNICAQDILKGVCQNKKSLKDKNKKDINSI